VGRELTFADARIIEMVKEHFVAVAADDWFQRRRKDAEGAFFRKVADQGPSREGETRQGIYALTADGRLLRYKNHQDPDVMREFLADALSAWKRLPAGQRAKGALQVPELTKVDSAFAPTLPKEGLIVNTYVRILDRQRDFFVHGSCEFPGGQRASHDHLWIRADEWQALLPADAKKGDEVKLPAKLLHRIARYHLVDNTRGEPPMWGTNEMRKADVKLIVAEVTPSEVRLKLTGAIVLATNANLKAAKRGYEAALTGDLRYEPTQRKITKFNVVAIGDHWGQGEYNEQARPGRTPLGVAFELADPARAADRLPPQFIREGGDYWNAER
jgi:hypothetical protein